VFGLVIAATTTTVVVGGIAIEDSRERLGTNNAENAMTQLDSQASLVALGNSDRQQVNLGASEASAYRVDGDAGEITVTFENPDGSTTQLLQQSMGEVVYEGGDSEIAYQGGGVWRSSGEGSVMISPPEFHYQDSTLTMPLVTVSGEDTISDRATITRQNTQQYYPDTGASPSLENPLESRELVITVESQYFEAWGQYFEERTEGTVTYPNPNEVRITLEPPLEEAFDNVVATTTSSPGIDLNGGSTMPSPNEEGVSYPSPDGEIQSQIDECDNTNTCEDPSDWSDASGWDTITTSGTYYVGPGTDFSGTLEVDNPDGDVLVVVDGNFNPDDVIIRNVDSGSSVTVYVRQSYRINTGGGDSLNNEDGSDPTEYRVFVHSDGTVDNIGNSGMFGVVYAPGSSCDYNGGGNSQNLDGAIICNDIDVNGKPNEFQYDPAVKNIDLGISNSNTVRIQYLHVSVTEVEVTNE
jgi:hypothetical protein